MRETVKRRLPVIISLVALAVIVGALWRSGAVPRTDADRAEHIASRIRCPFCNGESIAEATTPVARDLEEVIAEQVAAGRTDQQIFDFFAARYGESLLLDPPLLGWGWALWALPLAALLAGGAAVARRRRRFPAALAAALPGSLEEARLREHLDAVARDKREIAEQVAAGELDATTATALGTVLEAEAGTLESALEETGSGASLELPSSPQVWSRRRALTGVALLAAGATVVIVTLVLTADTGGGGGIVDAPPIDLTSVTVERLEEVVAAQPDVIPMRVFLASALMSDGDLSRAAFHFEEVLRRAESAEAAAWLEWIDVLAESPGPEQTARLEDIAAASPTLVSMQVEVGKILADQGELFRAAIYFGDVLEQERHPEAMAWMGWIAFQVGEFESAESFLVDALATAPDYPQAQWWLANVRLLGLNDPAGAVRPLESLITSGGVPEEFRAAAEDMLQEARAGS